jgi:DNA-directed RNA polymerase subunit E'/Rpb7
MERPIQKYKKENKLQSIYSRGEITKNVILPITAIGKNLKEIIDETIKFNYEGKCIAEGYIKPYSSKIKTFSGGLIIKGNMVSFEVIFECEICFPVEGMVINCVAQNITLAGISGISANELTSPIFVLVPKDYHIHFNNDYFNEIKVGDNFNIKVIGTNFELNDTRIALLGELKKKYK